ncbi:27606_t:CDS:1, partial [Gigaspora margarita]
MYSRAWKHSATLLAIHQNLPDKTELLTTNSECSNTNNTKKR